MTSMKVMHYLAKDVEYTGKSDPDAAEQIEVLKIPLPELKQFLFNLPAGTTLDLRVPGLLWLLEKQGFIKL